MPDFETHNFQSHNFDLEKLRFYREEIKSEFALLSNRVSAHISSQSFLIIAYAGSMGNQNPLWGHWFRLLFPLALSVLGIATSFQAGLGVKAATDTIALWRLKQNALVLNNAALQDFHVQRPEAARRGGEMIDVTHERSLVFARWTPPTFALAWLVFGALSFLLSSLG